MRGVEVLAIQRGLGSRPTRAGRGAPDVGLWRRQDRRRGHAGQGQGRRPGTPRGHEMAPSSCIVAPGRYRPLCKGRTHPCVVLQSGRSEGPSGGSDAAREDGGSFGRRINSYQRCTAEKREEGDWGSLRLAAAAAGPDASGPVALISTVAFMPCLPVRPACLDVRLPAGGSEMHAAGA